MKTTEKKSMYHTPGQWRVERTAGGFEVCSDDGETDSLVAVVYSVLDEQKEANARLIAAGPDMLEALEQAEIALEEHGDEGTVGFVRAAIAKAKGQQ